MTGAQPTCPCPAEPRPTATRYWLAHTWVEVLPDGTCYIVPYDAAPVASGRVAPATEAALACVATRIDYGVPLVQTCAWTDPERSIPALDDCTAARDRRLARACLP